MPNLNDYYMVLSATGGMRMVHTDKLADMYYALVSDSDEVPYESPYDNGILIELLYNKDYYIVDVVIWKEEKKF